MKKTLKSTFLIGLGVILPIAILAFFFTWVINGFNGLLGPLITLIAEALGTNFGLVSVISFIAILVVCYFVGLFVRTRVGNFIHNKLEKWILKRVPGYKILREAISQFTSKDESPFKNPVFIYPFGNDTKLLGFASDVPEDSKASITVFVPTSPNPTSGMIYLVPANVVEFIDANFEEVMKIIISGGMGASSLNIKE